MTRVAAELVPAQKSDLSTSRQSIPCSANSLNKPIPLMTPPTIRTETLGWSCSEVNCGRIRIPSEVGLISVVFQKLTMSRRWKAGPTPLSPSPIQAARKNCNTAERRGGRGIGPGHRCPAVTNRLPAFAQKTYLSANCAMRGSPALVMVPKVVLLLTGFETLGSLSRVWLRTLKYSALNCTLVSPNTWKLRAMAAFQTV